MSISERTKDFKVPTVVEGVEQLLPSCIKAPPSIGGDTTKCTLGSKTVSSSSKIKLDDQQHERFIVLWKKDVSLTERSHYPKAALSTEMGELDVKYVFQVFDCESRHIYYAYPAYLFGKASRNRDWFIFSSVWAVAIAAILFKKELKLDSLKKLLSPSALAEKVQSLFKKSPMLDGHPVLPTEFINQQQNVRQMRNFPFRSIPSLNASLLPQKKSKSSSSTSTAATSSKKNKKSGGDASSSTPKSKKSASQKKQKSKKKSKKDTAASSQEKNEEEEEEEEVPSSELVSSLLSSSTTVRPIMKSRNAIALAAQQLRDSSEEGIRDLYKLVSVVELPNEVFASKCATDEQCKQKNSSAQQKLVSELLSKCTPERLISEVTFSIHAGSSDGGDAETRKEAAKIFSERTKGQLTSQMMELNSKVAAAASGGDPGHTKMPIGAWAACLSAYARSDSEAAAFIKETRERMMSAQAKNPLFDILRRDLTFSDVGQQADDKNQIRYYFAYLLASEQTASLVHEQYAKYVGELSDKIEELTSLEQQREKEHSEQMVSIHEAYEKRLFECKQTIEAQVRDTLASMENKLEKLENEASSHLTEQATKLDAAELLIEQLKAKLADAEKKAAATVESAAVTASKRKRSSSSSDTTTAAVAGSSSEKLASLKSVFSEENKKARSSPSIKKDKGKEEAVPPPTTSTKLHADVDMAVDDDDDDDSSNISDYEEEEEEDESQDDDETEKTYEKSDDDDDSSRSMGDELLDESDENAESEDDIF